MAKEYKYEGETFLVDDSKGCYLEVSYQHIVGYVGVWVVGTPDRPYAWSPKRRLVTDEGLGNGSAPSATIESGLDNLCAYLLNQYQEEMGRKSFKPDEACEALHVFANNL